MHTEKVEGIVLRSQDFKERHRIITLFTAQGLISLIVKHISRKNTRLLALTTPFCHGEYLFQRSPLGLPRFQDGSILDDHMDLRQNFGFLQTAGTLAQTILTSQMPDKPAPTLFALYKSYHKQVPCFPDPMPLLASFSLKLLKHEGLLTISSQCTSCEVAPARLLQDGESVCPQHSLQEALPFSDAEWESLLVLSNAQQFSTLRSLTMLPSLSQKIQTLFQSRLSF